jgi:hypothetical protein
VAPPQSVHPAETADPLDTDDALQQWLTSVDEEIAAIPDAEHQAAIDRILTEAGYHRDQDGHLRRTAGADHD